MIRQLKNSMFIDTVESSVRTKNVVGDDFEQTTPLDPRRGASPKGETADLSKSQGAQVVAGRSLPRVYITSRIGSALHVMLFLGNTLQALFIFNGLRRHHCQRALLGYHYPIAGLIPAI